MKKELAIGLMSGTSADGISAVLAEFHLHEFRYLGMVTHRYPESVVEKVRRGPTLNAAEVSELNSELGELFAKATLDLLKKTHTKPSAVTCIGSHGQTIYHGPQDACANTFQIADPAIIAERTGLSVVSHFRQRDMAVGGQGAPLIPYFDNWFYGNGPIRAFQNIGGIANICVVGKGISQPIAFDTGPGNSLMDTAVRLITNGSETHDHHGLRAKRGQLRIDILNMMLAHEYFKKPPPKSTGLEMFGVSFLTQYFNDLLKTNPDDVLATLNQFTAITIQESVRRFIFHKYSIDEVVVSGGGVHNKTLFKKLGCLFAPIPVRSIEEFGYPSQAKEPLAFAFFGLRRWHHEVNHLPACTGAKQARSLGMISYA